MSSIRFKSKSPVLSAEVIRELRSVSSLSVSEIRDRAQRGETLIEFRIFSHPWDETKRGLREVLNLVESGRLPLRIFAFKDPPGFPAREEEITPEQLRKRFDKWSKIEKETQRSVELEEGHIQSPDEFVPLDEDEADEA